MGRSRLNVYPLVSGNNKSLFIKQMAGQKRVTAAASKQKKVDAPLKKRSAETEAIVTTVSRNLNQLRTRRSLSLEALAKEAGVSRGMLRQIELGLSVPTISLLWKIARALNVPFSALTSDRNVNGTMLMPAAKAKILSSASGGFTSRALFPFDAERHTEFYKLTLAANVDEISDPHPPGTRENLTVASGRVEIIVNGVSHILGPEDAIFFEADVPHIYRNTDSTTAVLYLAMTYVDTIG